MENVLWLARIFGPFFVILGLWVLFRIEDTHRMWASFRSTPGLFYIGGLLNLLIGLTMLSTYHAWTFSLAVWVTIVGWLQLIRGLLVFFAAEKVIDWTESLSPFSRGWAIIPLFFGVMMSWLAFFA